MSAAKAVAGVVYEIRLVGDFDPAWLEALTDLHAFSLPDGGWGLRGRLSDQAALFGVLSRLHDCNLTLDWVRRVPDGDLPGGAAL